MGGHLLHILVFSLLTLSLFLQAIDIHVQNKQQTKMTLSFQNLCFEDYISYFQCCNLLNLCTQPNISTKSNYGMWRYPWLVDLGFNVQERAEVVWRRALALTFHTNGKSLALKPTICCMV